MRERKFRIWDKKYKYMLFLDDLDYFINNNGLYNRLVQDFKNDEYVNVSEDYDVMDYTGLKDADGKEIYEGDIVPDIRLHGKACVVEFDQKYAGYYLKCSVPADDCGISCYRQRDLKIIGNIHQNPELLEKVK